MYDSILRMKLPDNVTLVGYADDTAVVCKGHRTQQIAYAIESTLHAVEDWLEQREMKLAVSKTEAVLITDIWKYELPKVTFKGTKIEWNEQITYLGVELDRGLSFGPHVEKVVSSADGTVAALTRIFPNLREPKQTKRTLYAKVIEAKLLYAIPA